MKNSKNIGILAAVVFAVGMVGFNLSDGTISLIDDVPLATMEAGVIMGHLEIIHADKDGNILSYQQTDNAIVNQGRNCAANLLFGPTANTACTDETPGVFNVIGLGNGTAYVGDNTGENLTGEVPVTENTDGIHRSEGPAATVSQLEAAVDVGADVSKTLISKQFTYIGSEAPNVIVSAGLFNQTAILNDSVFAIKNFPSVVNLNSGDLLTVNWEISISGTDAVN